MRSMFSARKMVNNLGRKVGGLTAEPPFFRPVFVPERRAEKSDRCLANLETSKTGFFSWDRMVIFPKSNLELFCCSSFVGFSDVSSSHAAWTVIFFPERNDLAGLIIH